MRAFLPLALACTAVVAVPAQAASRCAPWITDARGDTYNWGAAPAPVEDSRKADLLSADVKTDRTTLTAQLRLASLDSSTKQAFGHAYDLSFTSNGQRWVVFAVIGATGSFFAAGHSRLAQDTGTQQGPSASAESFEGMGPINGRVDEKTATIVLSAPLALFEQYGGVREALTMPLATTGSGVNANTPAYGASFTNRGDDGSALRTYRLGARACF